MVQSTHDGQSEVKLKVGMVGGGRGAFIGAVHRFALRLDNCIELVAGGFSSDAENARVSALELGVDPDRAYADWAQMAQKEAARPDGIDAVIIVTPNHLHAPIAKAFLNAGIEVICDKPLSTTLADAEELVALAKAKKRYFAVTLNNTGYAMVRQAREMIANGKLGRLTGIHTSYFQDWLTDPIDKDGQKQAEWRTDPARAGRSAVLADIGVHAFNLASFISGLDLEEVSADLTTVVPGRRLDDNANVLMRWQKGVTGTLIASQTSPGHYNDLSIRIYGEKGGLEWSALDPELLRYSPHGEDTRLIVRGGYGSFGESQRVSRMPARHPEGYIEGFGNFYRDVAEIILAHRAGRIPDPNISAHVPTVVEGAKGVKFVDAAVDSNQSGGRWVSARL